MILTAHQPVYLPWLGLFHKIALSDRFCIFDDVQYLKKDWNNRNQIKTQAGAMWLTVPVLTKGYREKPIRDIEINNTVNWRKKHWKSICVAYKKSPYFSRYADFFENLYEREWDNLVKLNDHILFYLLDELGINVEIHRASDESFHGTKSSLVLDMCKKLKSDGYIFGALGKDYVQAEEFEKADVKVFFQDYSHPVYPQSHGQFIPYLSVIDLLFNCGDKSLDIIMSGNVNKMGIQV
ncbi:MAG: WbqC family protein [Planctomycetes bacterium]|nr:WbqC family protein [Planctomycetota bacterium]